MATHSSILAWRIPWTEEPSRLQSMGSQKRQQKQSTSNSFPHHCTICKYLAFDFKKAEGVLLSDRALSYLTQLVNLCQ